jgi:uncharacterized protein YlxW (UPF0749 family)
MEENTPKVEPTVEPTQEPKVETPVETVEETKEPSRKELLRELSKEYGVNLFDADGLKQFKEYTESQKTEQDKLNEQLESYKQKETEWQSKLNEYESKLKASELGIKNEYLEDALKLANNDPNNLAEVVKKYPIFKSKGGIVIGQTDPNNNKEPHGGDEVEKYMAKNPLYEKYYKK